MLALQCSGDAFQRMLGYRQLDGVDMQVCTPLPIATALDSAILMAVFMYVLQRFLAFALHPDVLALLP